MDGDSDSYSENVELELDRLIQRIIWTAEVKISLAKRPERRRVRSTIANCLGFGRSKEEPLGAVLLVLDELIANAYQHTTTPGELRVTRQAQGTLIEVTDDDPDIENLNSRTRNLLGQGYHGLRLVAHLSLSWGVRPEEAGKVVWALVPAQMYDER